MTLMAVRLSGISDIIVRIVLLTPLSLKETFNSQIILILLRKNSHRSEKIFSLQ